MLYPKNQSETLSEELFQNPTSEYRGTPFWAWNGHPDKEELKRQIEIFRQMGFGGFHMHVRSGMDLPYLSPAFFDCIRACVETAKEKGMLAWLYDEDRWPSGAVGGMLTKELCNRQHFLLFTGTPYCGKTYRRPLTASGSNWAERNENGELLACYDVSLDEAGCLISYRRIAPDEEAAGQKWYAYIETPSPNPWYNGETYADLLNPEVTRQFVEMTHAAYKRELGGQFDPSLTPAIFTDEPQMAQKRPLPYAHATDAEAVFPWSVGMEADFQKENGMDLLARLPELFWNLESGHPSEMRWRFHNFLAERFAASFADICGKWCEENGLPLTGHVMREPTLASQTGATGETMRSYRSFTFPGIDMLRNSYEYTTAKQAQSAVRQYGRKAMTSELYGVTGWNVDLAGYKRQGDWQAALGVTVRVPHLSFLSMGGEAKRDYPASIGYQSPWWQEFSKVEDHFARVATAMTRGKSVCRVAVLHPIESYWLTYGPEKESAAAKEKLDKAFCDLTRWLLFGGIDFDFISESLLPDLCKKGSNPLQVGKMEYDTVIVPPILTLRSSTLSRLEDFQRAGGELFFLGKEQPAYVDALPSDAALPLYEASRQLPFEKSAVLRALEHRKQIWIQELGKGPARDLLFHLKEDQTCKWLFLAQGRRDGYAGAKCFAFSLPGSYSIEEYDTATGVHRPLAVTYAGDKTHFTRTMYHSDSLLLCLTPLHTPKQTVLDGPFTFHTDSPNVLLLDAAEYALDDGDYRPRTELLRADNACRKKLGYAPRESAFVQPWVIGPEQTTHTIRLRFTVECEVEIHPVLAGELPTDARICWNGEWISNQPDGWYVDKAIKTLPLPKCHIGTNVLELVLPFGKTTNTEWFYLLGDFGVRIEGSSAVITEKPALLSLGDLAQKGYPFFGGKLTYKTVFTADGKPMTLTLPSFGGSYVKVYLDGKEQGNAMLPPYSVDLGCPTKGTHELALELCLPRTNSFGPVHNTAGAGTATSPNTYRTAGADWTDGYALVKQGLFEPILLEEA